MILRNNAHILVIAPALVMSHEEIELMVRLIGEAIAEAAEHFGMD